MRAFFSLPAFFYIIPRNSKGLAYEYSRRW